MHVSGAGVQETGNALQFEVLDLSEKMRQDIEFPGKATPF